MRLRHKKMTSLLIAHNTPDTAKTPGLAKRSFARLCSAAVSDSSSTYNNLNAGVNFAANSIVPGVNLMKSKANLLNFAIN